MRTAVLCNNYEVYVYLINNTNFDPLKIIDQKWIKIIFDKYNFDSRYLDELINCNCNIKFPLYCVILCPSLEIFHKIKKKLIIYQIF